MPVTRITFTDDADVPRVAHLGATVVWYAYRRAADKGLYLQRGIGGVLGAETLIAAPVDKIDMIVDPDNVRAWIYFTTDGALRCIEVTDKTETPTVQVFQRGQGWYERLEGGLGGVGIPADFGFLDEITGAYRVDDGPVELYPPTLALLDIGSVTHLLLVIARGSVHYGRVDKFRVFRRDDHDGPGWGWHADVALPTGDTVVSLPVPRGLLPAVRQWAATAVRLVPLYESAWSNVVTESEPGDAAVGKFGGLGVGGSWATVDLVPAKNAATDSYQARRHGGAGVEHSATFTDKTPIKNNAGTDEYPTHRHGGSGVGGRWAVNGFEIITP